METCFDLHMDFFFLPTDVVWENPSVFKYMHFMQIVCNCGICMPIGIGEVEGRMLERSLWKKDSIHTQRFIISTKRVMFLLVCLSVCKQDYSETTWWIFMKLGRRIEHVGEPLNVGQDPDNMADSEHFPTLSWTFSSTICFKYFGYYREPGWRSGRLGEGVLSLGAFLFNVKSLSYCLFVLLKYKWMCI